jgi:hypothetical protein
MKNKSKVSVIVFASFVAVIASVGMIYSLTPTTQDIILDVQALPEREEYSPHLQKIRSGTPTLDSFEIENPNLDNLTFKELKPDEHTYLWRAITDGATFLSNAELEDFFTNIDEPRHRFKMLDDDGNLKYYRVTYSAPPLDYESHWFKSLEYIEERNDTFIKTKNSLDRQILDVIDRPYRWIQVDEAAAYDLKQTLNRDGTFFNPTTTDRGSVRIQLQYLGPFSEYMNTEDFKEFLSEQNPPEEDHHE